MSASSSAGPSSLHPLQPLTAEQAAAWRKSLYDRCLEVVKTLPKFEWREDGRAPALDLKLLLRSLAQHAGELRYRSDLHQHLSNETVKMVTAITAAIDYQLDLVEGPTPIRSILHLDTMVGMEEYLRHAREILDANMLWEHTATACRLRTSMQELADVGQIHRTRFVNELVPDSDVDRYNLDSNEPWTPLKVFLDEVLNADSGRDLYSLDRCRTASPRIDKAPPSPTPSIRISAPPGDAPTNASPIPIRLDSAPHSPQLRSGHFLRPPSFTRGRRSLRVTSSRVVRSVSPSPRRAPSPCSSPSPSRPSSPSLRPFSVIALGKRRAIDDGSPTPQRRYKRRRLARAELHTNTKDAESSAGESSSSEGPVLPPPWVLEDPPTPDSSTAVSLSDAEDDAASESSCLSRSSSLDVNVGGEAVEYERRSYPTRIPSTTTTFQDFDADMASVVDDEDATSYTTADDCIDVDDEELEPPPPEPIPTPSPRAPVRHSKFIGRRRCWDGAMQFVQRMLRF
ncbi:hypothetical protein C8Q70DRAFT_422868 [Cubamyces menziesii]|uniref:Uncharacterized protein n=1 Tax=Trametes cubensis TaxID=1111947 RepID=A0AAD7U513_9APHY|nr:hypothetical protein C8Q70DRAFT_422868 [Cubamyces menziesii]KAJ8496954.1 hypothetical protein ONZ51_g808 [Trametes cubensis]